ncbi:unnamed protein product [Rotaria sordida]|uniref:Uncharacterized protein n=1 Tax=Rotaria sordida TaxID=392033 RepID=A0A815EVV1_9BILA|nr:unnamed protein product [Rotaria sordida]
MIECNFMIDIKYKNKYFRNSNEMKINAGVRRNCLSLSRSYSTGLNQSSNKESCYTIILVSDNSKQIVDCQIIIVNIHQKYYAEEISSHLVYHGLSTSVILLRKDYTLTEAIKNAAREKSLYGIIAMPMDEKRRTASFHILYGQTEGFIFCQFRFN